MRKVTYLHEFLVRAGRNGVTGHHVKINTDVLDDDGTVLSSKEGDAMTAAAAAAAGYPLSDVYATINTGTLATLAEAQRRAEVAEAERDAARAELAALRAAQ